ncbi:MAG: PIN domain-containing protein [Candidatus Acidiferrales bacterium]
MTKNKWLSSSSSCVVKERTQLAETIVLDANILIRAVMGHRVRQLLDTYENHGILFYAPDVAFADAEKYLPALLTKRGKPVVDILPSLEYLQDIVESVDQDFYGPFVTKARQRLRGRDDDDWPVLATALGLACAMWTEDSDFFGTGIAVWTTSRIEIFLRAQAKAPDSGES